MIKTTGTCDFCGNTFTKTHIISSNGTIDHISPSDAYIEVNNNRLHLKVGFLFDIGVPEFQFKRGGSKYFDTCEPCLEKLKTSIDHNITTLEEVMENIIEGVKGNVTKKSLTKFDVLEIDTDKPAKGFADRETTLTTFDQDNIPF
tara:strand:- start:2572 stop:3006 length:435 start_codon:yes stop_codon:yes gene_type:complete